MHRHAAGRLPNDLGVTKRVRVTRLLILHMTVDGLNRRISCIHRM
jgi:hypothetical protein